jgi:nicotinamidase/pyrazinamidase
MAMPENSALLIVDIQNDFLPGGALAVPDGDKVVSVVNAISAHFEVVLAAQDWHPPGHGSFASTHGKQPGEVIDLAGIQQELWPDHCVQGTKGAEFADDLELDRARKCFKKGVDPEIDSYGAFYDNGWRRATGLADYLRENNIERLYIVGLALDYCVKYSVLDGIKLGFDMYVVIDACRAINVHPEDDARAIEEMRAAGAHIVTSADILAATS